MAAPKSSSRKTAAKKKKPAKAGKPKAAVKKVVKKVAKKIAKAPKRPTARKKAAAPLVRAAVSPAVAELDQRIAIVRNNLRELAELATASSGASTEELTSGRIAEQEEQLKALTDQREALVRGKG